MVMPAPPREPGWRPNPSGLLALLVVVGLVVGTWFVSGGDPGTPTGSGPPPGYASEGPSEAGGAGGSRGARAADVPVSGEVDPESGLTWVELVDLPPEATRTVALIADGGPFPEDEDGSVFFNREGLLPPREEGYYAEYTVPTPGSPDRGARRIVAGEPDELFWTDDHYESFRRIVP